MIFCVLFCFIIKKLYVQIGRFSIKDFKYILEEIT